MVLFTFGNKLEVDRILSSEPWSFDKHLMTVQRFNKDIVLSDSDFHFATFWVQVHNILARYRNRGGGRTNLWSYRNDKPTTRRQLWE